jgi:hypothetical protein
VSRLWLGSAGRGEGLEEQVEVAEDGVVEELEAAGVDADVVRGPACAEPSLRVDRCPIRA